ncbi:MAG: amidohydrolase [Firmicutes bacterium]|nr:amidohydrolase [Bacillota bacterium]
MVDADVAVEDGIIAAVGSPPAGWTPDERIEAAGKIVMPGLVNAHTHAAMTLFRGYGDDLPLQEWLSQRIWPAEAKLTAEHVYWGSLLAIVEMLRSGTTTFADMYFFMEEVARAVEEAGIRAVLARGLIGLDPAKTEKDLAAGVEFARAYRGAAGGRITTMLGPHAPYTCPDGFLREVVAAAAEEDLALHIHVSETRRENEEMRARTGKTPVAHLAELGVFSRPVLLAHGVWLEEGDIAVLARHRVGVAHCPGSNLKLASGIAPISALHKAGVTVGLGTDGAASNNNLDLFREVRLAALIHKVREEDATAIPAGLALRFATVGGAASLGLAEKIGQITPGFRADLIMLSLHRPHLVPGHDPISHLVYAAEGFADVTDVMVDGEFLLRDGRFTRLDEERIMREAERLGRSLVG